MIVWVAKCFDLYGDELLGIQEQKSLYSRGFLGDEVTFKETSKL